MQEDLVLLFALLVAHLVGDFVAQTGSTACGKMERRKGSFLLHGAIHYLAALTMLALFTSVPLASFRAQLVLVVMMISHVAIDVGKVTLIWRNSDNDGPPLFLLDQALHIMIVLIGGTWLVPCFSGLSLAIDRASQSVPEALVIAAVYIVVVFASAHLIRFLLGPLAQKLDSDETSDIKGLEDAGKYIGWLERFLVLTAVVSGSPTAVGLIIAAKSIFRFPEIKGRPFTEYFLIGTLLSITIAVIGGLCLTGLLVIFGRG